MEKTGRILAVIVIQGTMKMTRKFVKKKNRKVKEFLVILRILIPKYINLTQLLLIIKLFQKILFSKKINNNVIIKFTKIRNKKKIQKPKETQYFIRRTHYHKYSIILKFIHCLQAKINLFLIFFVKTIKNSLQFSATKFLKYYYPVRKFLFLRVEVNKFSIIDFKI